PMGALPRFRLASALLSVLVLALLAIGCSDRTPATPPNIVFVVMDDVGIDQMKLFGYGGADPPKTPTIDQIAAGGVQFRNTWSMPACSTSRAVFYTGRYPLRTNVFGALGPSDLAQRGYESGLFGKFHIGLQGNDPAGLRMVHDVGWDYFAGWLDETGDPSSIDTTAGGVAPPGT